MAVSPMESLSLSAELASSRTLRQIVLRLCAESGIQESAAQDLSLAACEAFNNAVLHGECERGEAIQVSVRAAGRSCEVVLDYRGSPFAVHVPMLPEPDATNGRGLVLIHALTDRVQYEFRGGHTRVTLAKDNPLEND